MRASGSGSWRKAEREALYQWAVQKSRVLDVHFIEQFSRVSEGAEHVVYHDERRGLAIKATHPNGFGHSAKNEGLRASPLEYLQRLGWQNALCGDDIKIIGITCTEGHMEVITSQPWIVSDLNSPTPSLEEIDKYFEELGFQRVEINPDVPIYFDRHTQMIIADAHERNVLRMENGKLAPIDVVIGQPDTELLCRINLLLGER